MRVWAWLVVGCSSAPTNAPSGHSTAPFTPSTGETGEPPAPSSWSTEPVPGLVTAQRVHRTLGEPEAVALRCRALEDPRDEHVQHLEPTDAPSFLLLGLLAATTYDCELTTSSGAERVSFVTEPLPAELPSFEVSGRGAPWDGWLLLNESPQRDGVGQHLLVVDLEGRIRWYLPVVGGTPDIDATWTGNELVYGGGYGVRPTRVTLDGTVVARAGRGEWNHHVEPLPDGQVLTLRKSAASADGATWTGFAIVLLSPDLEARTLVWESQRGVDDGWLQPPTDGPDPYHANALEPLADGGVLVSLYGMQQVVRLGPDGRRRWTLGRGGDFQLLEADGSAAADARWFRQMHDPELAGDRLLLYDNGVEEPRVGRSRALELELDEVARTARIVWEWTEPGWLEPIWGDADRLPNGHVSITIGHCEGCPGGPGPTRVVEVDPATGAVVWQVAATVDDIGAYRSQRVAPCALFPDRTECETPGR